MQGDCHLRDYIICTFPSLTPCRPEPHSNEKSSPHSLFFSSLIFVENGGGVRRTEGAEVAGQVSAGRRVTTIKANPHKHLHCYSRPTCEYLPFPERHNNQNNLARLDASGSLYSSMYRRHMHILRLRRWQGQM